MKIVLKQASIHFASQEANGQITPVDVASYNLGAKRLTDLFGSTTKDIYVMQVKQDKGVYFADLMVSGMNYEAIDKMLRGQGFTPVNANQRLHSAFAYQEYVNKDSSVRLSVSRAPTMQFGGNHGYHIEGKIVGGLEPNPKIPPPANQKAISILGTNH